MARCTTDAVKADSTTKGNVGRSLLPQRMPPARNSSEIMPYKKGDDFYSYLHEEFAGTIYADKKRESDISVLEHLVQSGDFAAEAVLPPNDFYMKLLGLVHDAVEDTNGGHAGSFPVQIVFEDPQFDYGIKKGNGEKPRAYIPELRAYAMDGLFYEADTLGRSLVRSTENLTRTSEDGNYLYTFSKLMQFDVNQLGMELGVLDFIFKVAGDRRSNAQDACALSPARQIRNALDDQTYYVPLLREKLKDIDEMTKPDAESAGDYLFHYDDVDRVCQELLETHDRNIKRLRHDLSKEDYETSHIEALERMGGMRLNDEQVGIRSLKRQLMGEHINYQYLKIILERFCSLNPEYI